MALPEAPAHPLARLEVTSMCDDDTEAENELYLEQLRINRRNATLGAGAVVAGLVTGCSPAASPAPNSGTAPEPRAAPPSTTPKPEATAASPPPTPADVTSDRMLTIETPDGRAEAFFASPKSGKHPGVLMWPDVVGLRDAYKTMARRLAAEGYAVLAVNQYYRTTKLPAFKDFAEWRSEAAKKKFGPMRAALTAEGIAKDGAAFTAWLDQQKEVDTGKKLGTMGYCMGGPYAFRTAAVAPERVGVLASFHGGGLVTDDPNSPHTLFSKMKAAALVCIAQNDDKRDPKAKDTLRESAKNAGITADIEVYPAQHGWCTIDAPIYDKAQAEKAWSKMLAMYQAHL